jgi:2-polyprenyl-3-methyl-5-hydroxy-6-metoxy-1,4-benzoquinol methylase
VRSCPLCGASSRTRLVTRDLNRGIGEERFRYAECERCRALFLDEVPDDLGRYYPDSYYEPQVEAVPTERAKLALVRRHASGGRLVEVGPGAGGFASEAKAAGFEVAVIETDERAYRHLRESVGVEAVQSDDPAGALSRMPGSHVIALWHVIEHLRDPWALLESAAANLEPGGVLVVATPNPRAFQLRVLGGRWTHIDAPRHLVLIPATALVEAAGRHGLERAQLVYSDRTGRDWNAFGWQQMLRRRKLGSALALALAPIERTGARGSAYTAVFRKNRPR